MSKYEFHFYASSQNMGSHCVRCGCVCDGVEDDHNPVVAHDFSGYSAARDYADKMNELFNPEATK